ncbi:hypothetical protein NLU13_2030 [Sarocladium strictum]|uniref:Uncharacterized protein n=1 Tax=Sarocladium strictum TaxID=5046 RepID=A0AA39GS24_SARSR|nr:hypothetical protein NLU13_2030 [Sarocladium strictum]
MAPQLVEGDLRQKDTVIFWLALALIVVSVAFLSTIISLSVRRFLRRPSRYQKVGKQEQEQKQKSGFKKVPRSLLWGGKKREPTLEDRIEEEELQREYMIRKSYASRASLRSSSQLSHCSTDADVEAGVGQAVVVAQADGIEEEARLHGVLRHSPGFNHGVAHSGGFHGDLGVRGFPVKELTRPASRHARSSSRSSSIISTPQMLGTELSGKAPMRAMIR